MAHTLVAMFDSRDDAERARDRLTAIGFDRSDVSIRMQDDWDSGSSSMTSDTNTQGQHPGGVGAWFRSLFGMDDDAYEVRSHGEALRRGGVMLSVDARDEAQADRAADVLQECGAVDLDERSTQWRDDGWDAGTGSTVAAGGMAGSLGTAGLTQAGTTGTTLPTGTSATSIASGEDVGTTKAIPIVEEELAIGKRAVRRGAIRVYTRVVETPVEEQVRLREEHAEVIRRDVDRPATEADLQAAMTQGTLEVTETSEEAVVSKRARVTGEVEVGKRVTERTETVRDTIRHTEVQVDEDAHATAKRDGTLGRDETPTGRRNG